MKCAKCGQEFGNGSTCINCGADRVSAFGEFQGFGNGRRTVDESTNAGYVQPEASGYTVCYHCGTLIPNGSKYCPQCKSQLLIECPNCKHICSTEFPACPNCGVDRNDYFEQLRKAQREQAEREQKEKEEKERERERLAEEQMKIQREMQLNFERIRQSSLYGDTKRYLLSLNSYLFNNSFPGKYAGVEGLPFILLVFILSFSPWLIVCLICGEFEIDGIFYVFATLSIFLTIFTALLYNKGYHITDGDVDVKRIISSYISNNPISDEKIRKIVKYLVNNHWEHNLTSHEYNDDTVDYDIIDALSKNNIPVVCQDGRTIMWE